MKTIETKPEILAVKLGFNPNSSSIGIMVKIFIYNTLAISFIFATLGLLLNFKRNKAVKKVADEDKNTDAKLEKSSLADTSTHPVKQTKASGSPSPKKHANEGNKNKAKSAKKFNNKKRKK